MIARTPVSCTAFAGTARIASGSLAEVAARARTVLDADETATVLIFDDETSEVVEADLRGSPAEVARRFSDLTGTPDATAPVRRDGRPKRSVVAREVTLLPRHWDWLRGQRGGASAALRRLVEQASRDGAGADRVRRAQETGYRFLGAMAGDEAGFEEAVRALFAGDRERFQAHSATWPVDVIAYALALSADAFEPAG